MSDELPVFYETIQVGTITVTGGGAEFSYDQGWVQRRGAFPISITMPFEAKIGSQQLLPWLENLLPEGASLQSIGRNLGISVQDTIGLIGRLGLDTAGALSIGVPWPGRVPDYRLVPSDAELERIINEMPAKPFRAGEDGVSMSLAGAQDKLPVFFANGEMHIPVDGAASTHILKPDNNRLYGSVQNEALCLTLARRVGLSVAEVTTGRAGDRSYLLVARYDRVEREERWLRLHQEDFCQALCLPPAVKYERNGRGPGGPGLPDLFELTRRYAPPSDTMALLQAVILNVLLTNVDSHAKNYSLFISSQGARLAPLYDLMCAAAWEGITKNMSQAIGGQTRGGYVYARHWRRMAEACGLRAEAICEQVSTLARRVMVELDGAVAEVRAMPAGDHPMLGVFVNEISRRCRTVCINLVDEKPEAAPSSEPGD
jgi:serine/threonine-protein kinase HipA